MNTVKEIQQAAEGLGLSDFDKLALWVSARYHDLWKRQMERDASDGKLDFLFDEADIERQGGALHDAWGDQMRRDVASGKLAKLLAKVDTDMAFHRLENLDDLRHG